MKAKYLTIIPRNRAEYRLILSRRGRKAKIRRYSARLSRIIVLLFNKLITKLVTFLNLSVDIFSLHFFFPRTKLHIPLEDSGTPGRGTRGRMDVELGDAWTWNSGTWDSETPGRGTREVGTRGRGDAGTRGRGDAGTRGRGDAGTRGRGDAGTRGRGDAVTQELGDVGTQGRDKQTTPEFWAEFAKLRLADFINFYCSWPASISFCHLRCQVGHYCIMCKNVIKLPCLVLSCL